MISERVYGDYKSLLRPSIDPIIGSTLYGKSIVFAMPMTDMLRTFSTPIR